MKNLFFSTALLLTFSGSGLVAQNGTLLEYTLSTSKGASGNIKTYYAPQGTRVEMQMSNPQVPVAGFNHTSITKTVEPTMVYILDERNRTYIGTGIQQGSAIKNSENNRTVKIIGKEKVGIYNCTHAIVTEGDNSREYWTTTDITDYEKYSKANTSNKYMGSDNDYAILSKNNAAGLVVKTLSRDSRSGDITTMELSKLEKKELNAALFEIPADYRASAITAPPVMQGIDMNKFQSMTPEERAKYIEEMKKQYGQ